MRRKGFLSVLIGVGVLSLSLFAPKLGYAAEYAVDLLFETAGQSMWAPGPAAIADFQYCACLVWNESGSIGGFAVDPIFGSRTGLELRGSTRGRLGFELSAQYDSGSVNVTYPVGVMLGFPDKVDTSTFTISSSYVVNPGASMTTNSPEASADLKAIAEIFASVGGEGCLVSACVGGDVTLIDASGELTLLQLDTATTSFSGPVLGGFANVTAEIPQIATTASLVGENLVSSGEDHFVEATADLDLIATSLLGFPPLSGSVDVGIVLSYTVLDVQAGIDSFVTQDFLFDPNLLVELELETGETFMFPVGSSVEIPVPDFVGGELGITPTFWLNNIFSNDTGLRIDPLLTVEALTASVSAFGESLTLGPLFDGRFTTPGVGIPLLSRDFELGGFPHFTTASFSVTIPIPSTLILLGSGLLLLRGVARRRMQEKRIQ